MAKGKKCEILVINQIAQVGLKRFPSERYAVVKESKDPWAILVREDLIGQAAKGTPSVMDYKLQADADSMLNTPPTYSMYIAGLVFKWLKQQGGLPAMEKKNVAKAKLLYDYLDTTQFYGNPVAKEDRSRMNVPFTLKDAKLDEGFLKGAAERGMVQLKGHRSVGGMRASIYNAMPIEGVQCLVEYMKDFEKKNG